MKALLHKELRELRTPVLAVLAGLLALGLIDLAYNWTEQRFVGLSLGFCLVVSVLASFFGGANAVSRETADQTAFLGSWPVSRREIWIAKLAANLGAVVAVSVGGYIACGGLLALRGYHFGATYLQITGLPLSDLAIFCLTLFAFGFSASWLATTLSRVTALAAVLLAVPTALWTFLMLGGASERWGPFVGFRYGSLSMEQQTLFEVLPFLLFSAAVLGAGRRALLRYPLLDVHRRARLTYRLFAALAAVSIGAGGVAVVALTPRPVVSPTHHAHLAANGRRLALLAGPERSDASTQYDSLWALSSAGGQPRLAARGPVAMMDLSPDGRHILFAWGASATGRLDRLWIADLDGGRLWRTPAASWPGSQELPAHWSPRGKRLLLYGPNGLMLLTGHAVERVLEIKEQTRVVGWTRDENGIYTAAPSRSGFSMSEGETPQPASRPLWRTDLRTGDRTVVAQVSEDLDLRSVSPDGRWIVGERSVEEWVKLPWGQTGDKLFPSRRPELQLVDPANGAIHVLPQLRLCKVPFTPDGRYLWCRHEPPRSFESVATELHVIDLRTLRLVRTIPAPPIARRPSGVSGVVIGGSYRALDVLAFAAGSGLACIADSAATPVQPTSLASRVWVADPDGDRFRPAPAFVGQFVGLTAAGELVLWRQPAQFVRLNPETATESVIWEP